MTGFTTDPGGLADSAPGYEALKDDLLIIYNRLTDALNVEGDCWGSDDPGRAFASKYVINALNAIEHMHHTTKGLQSLVDGICTWAKNYVTADDLAKLDASRIDSP